MSSNQGTGNTGSNDLLILRGFVDLFSLALQPPAPELTAAQSPTPADAPHRRLAAKLSSGEHVAPEDVSTWFLTTHHDAMGAHSVNCTVALLGADGEPATVDQLLRERRRLGR